MPKAAYTLRACKRMFRDPHSQQYDPKASSGVGTRALVAVLAP
jgi:hypothetical protein